MDHGQGVTASLQEWSLTLTGMAHAGSVQIHITNDGRFTHSFAIGVGGQAKPLGSNIAPGASADLTLDLTPGEYAVWCPIGSHRANGLEGKLQVY